MDLQKRKILVTGADGFIGNYLFGIKGFQTKELKE